MLLKDIVFLGGSLSLGLILTSSTSGSASACTLLSGQPTSRGCVSETRTFFSLWSLVVKAHFGELAV